MADVTEQTLNLTPQYLENIMRLMEEFAKMLKEMVKNHDNERVAREFLRYLEHNGELLTFLNKDFNEKDFVEEMQSMGCDCMSARCTDGINKGLIMCTFKSEDLPFAMMAREKAMSRGRQMMDEYGNIMRPASEISISTLNSMAMEVGLNHVSQARGLDEARAKFFMEELRTSGVVFARASRREEGRMRTDFFFLPDDAERARNALARMNIEFAGISGNYASQRLDRDIRMAREALNRIEKEGDEFYVVSAGNPNNVIHVTNSSVTHQLLGEGRPYSYRMAGGREGNYDHVALRRVYKQEVDAMRHPVVLSREEYERGMQDAEVMKEMVSSKMSKVAYRDESDKLQAYTEKFFKNKLNQKLYGQIRSGEFDLQAEMERFQAVREGKLPLAEYLDVSGDMLAPNGIDEKASERTRELHGYCDSLSPEEMEAAVDLIGSCIGEYGKAEYAIGARRFEDHELRQSLEEIIEDAENNLTISEANLLGEYDDAMPKRGEEV